VATSPATSIGFRNALLRALPPSDQRRLRPLLKRVGLTFNTVIHEPGDNVTGLVFVEEGIASLLVVLGSGESIEVAMVGSEGVLGLPAVFGERRSRFRVLIQGAGFGYRLGNGALKKAMENDGDLSRVLLQFAYRQSIETAQTAACNRLHSAEERLARWLLMMHDRTEGDELMMTHEFLALMLGTRRSTVTIASGILAKAGVIEHHRGRIRVADRAGLEHAACECYELMRAQGIAPPTRTK
jgi:CRP-like cAMP-binding protein